MTQIPGTIRDGGGKLGTKTEGKPQLLLISSVLRVRLQFEIKIHKIPLLENNSGFLHSIAPTPCTKLNGTYQCGG